MKKFILFLANYKSFILLTLISFITSYNLIAISPPVVERIIVVGDEDDLKWVNHDRSFLRRFIRSIKHANFKHIPIRSEDLESDIPEYVPHPNAKHALVKLTWAAKTFRTISDDDLMSYQN